MAARTIDLGFTIPAYATDCEITRGEAVTLQFTRAGGTAITSFTISGYLRTWQGAETITLTLTGTLVSSGSTGVFTMALTAAQTAALLNQSYQLQVWRTDSGSETLLSNVTITMLEGQ